MKKSLLSMALISVFGTGYAVAEQPSFNYLEGGYAEFEDADGYGVRGSVELTDIIYLNGSYKDLTFDETSPDIDLTFISFGVGARLPVSDNTSVYAEANYLDSEAESGSFSSSEDGHQLAIGVRSMVTDTTELYGEIANTEYEETKTDIALGARQYFTDNFGIYAEYNQDDFENDGYEVGVSFKF